MELHKLCAVTEKRTRETTATEARAMSQLSFEDEAVFQCCSNF